MTTTQAEAATSPESPATVPTLQDHAAKLAPLDGPGARRNGSRSSRCIAASLRAHSGGTTSTTSAAKW